MAAYLDKKTLLTCVMDPDCWSRLRFRLPKDDLYASCVGPVAHLEHYLWTKEHEVFMAEYKHFALKHIVVGPSESITPERHYDQLSIGIEGHHTFIGLELVLAEAGHLAWSFADYRDFTVFRFLQRVLWKSGQRLQMVTTDALRYAGLLSDDELILLPFGDEDDPGGGSHPAKLI